MTLADLAAIRELSRTRVQALRDDTIWCSIDDQRALCDFYLAHVDVVAQLSALQGRVEEMGELLQEAYKQGMFWRGDRIYKYVAEPPTDEMCINCQDGVVGACVCGRSKIGMRP